MACGTLYYPYMVGNSHHTVAFAIHYFSFLNDINFRAPLDEFSGANDYLVFTILLN